MKVDFNWFGLFAVLMSGYFVWLRVHGDIDWSWWWVFAPIWITVSFSGVVLLIVLLVIARFR